MRTFIRCFPLFMWVTLGILATSYVVAGDMDKTFVYSDLFNPRDSYVLNVDEQYLAEGDLRFGITLCGLDQPYICFNSRAFSFAVPKISMKQEWDYMGHHYKFIDSRTYSLLGKRMELRRITTNLDGVKFIFLYSEKLGLVGISVSAQSNSKHYLLRGERGFGSRKE